jgi:hypothetical protein
MPLYFLLDSSASNRTAANFLSQETAVAIPIFALPEARLDRIHRLNPIHRQRGQPHARAMIAPLLYRQRSSKPTAHQVSTVGLQVYPSLFQTSTAELSLPVIGFFAGSVLIYNELPSIRN